MATISGYDSASIGVLFSSLNSGSTKSSSGISDLLGISYSDYATIQNGSYTKLMKAYYSDSSSGDSVSAAKPSTATSKDSTALLGRIESAADDLTAAESKLKKTGTDSLFTKSQVKDSDGNVSYDYDAGKIYNAVNDFVKSYNSLIEEGADAKTGSISRSTQSLVNLTKANSKLLKDVGITIGTDNKLSIDEKTFKSADMNKVKSLFQSSGGYGYQASVQAGYMKSYAKSEAEKANTYGKTGMYTYNYSTGEIYNTTT